MSAASQFPCVVRGEKKQDQTGNWTWRDCQTLAHNFWIWVRWCDPDWYAMYPVGPVNFTKPWVLPTRQGSWVCNKKTHLKEGARCKADSPAIVLVDAWPCILESRHYTQRHILSPYNCGVELLSGEWEPVCYKCLVTYQGTPCNRLAVLRNKGGILEVLSSPCSYLGDGEMQVARRANTALQGSTPCVMNCRERETILWRTA